MMRTFALACWLVSGAVMASGGGIPLEDPRVDLKDIASLRKGAETFAHYCLTCHSASFMRYSRIGQDLGWSEEEVMNRLVSTNSKIGDPMTVAMPKAEAKKWFGRVPPDLSVITRSRGSEWVYTYLKSFYVDPSRPFGVNNLVFKDVGMPHVLWELQGYAEPIIEEHDGHKVVTGAKVVKPGRYTPEQYEQTVHDLVNFLTYVGEPSKIERQRLGLWVLLFLAVFTALAYLLKREYWRDIH
ncbi:Cytochrome c1 [Gammaproteobacteria bacterium]